MLPFAVLTMYIWTICFTSILGYRCDFNKCFWRTTSNQKIVYLLFVKWKKDKNTFFRMSYHCSNTIVILVFIIPVSSSSYSRTSTRHIRISFFKSVFWNVIIISIYFSFIKNFTYLILKQRGIAKRKYFYASYKSLVKWVIIRPIHFYFELTMSSSLPPNFEHSPFTIVSVIVSLGNLLRRLPATHYNNMHNQKWLFAFREK